MIVYNTILHGVILTVIYAIQCCGIPHKLICHIMLRFTIKLQYITLHCIILHYVLFYYWLQAACVSGENMTHESYETFTRLARD